VFQETHLCYYQQSWFIYQTLVLHPYVTAAWPGAKFMQVEMDATGGTTFVDKAHAIEYVPYAWYAENAVNKAA
jgi:hypothetical protein